MLTPARVLAVVSTVVVMLIGSATAASADDPITWETGEDKSTLEYLAVIVGIPAAIAIVLVLFSLVVHRRHYVPPAPSTELEKH